jgi:hypothetical protein
MFSTRFECSFSQLKSDDRDKLSEALRRQEQDSAKLPVGAGALNASLNRTMISMKKPHSKRVEKMENYTRNEWRRWKTTLESSGEDRKLHSKRVENNFLYTRNEWRRIFYTLEMS